jgi:hypothetical protein
VRAQNDRALNDFIAGQFYETLGNQIGNTATTVVTGLVRYGKAQDDANREIARTRQQFWADYDAGRRNTPAESEFGRALLTKDLVLMSMILSEGRPAPIVQGVNALFGQLDGGVRNPAKAAFDEWVNAIRFMMGADRQGQLLIVTSPADLLSALQKTSRWYDVYRRWRDWAEFRAHGINRPEPTTTAPGENDLARLANRPRTTTPAEWRLLRQEYVQEGGVRLIRCTYNRGANAPPAYVASIPPTVHFWPEKVGATRGDIQRTVSADPRSPARMLLNPSLWLGDVAVSECPGFEEEARALSTTRAPGAIDGRWIVQRQGGPQRDPVLEKLFGDPNKQPETLDIVFNGFTAVITGNGPGWGGTGRLNGRNGYLDITFFDTRTKGRTDFVLDENNVLRGTVRGAGVESYNFIAVRQGQEFPSLASSSPVPATITSGNVSGGAVTTTPAARPAPVTPAPAFVTPTAMVPVGTMLMIRILEPVNLLNPNPASYRAVVERQVVAQGSVIVAAGAAATVRVVRTGPNPRTGVFSVALTVESIVQDGATVGVTTAEVLRPAPVPGTRYNGAPVLPAQTRQFFTVTALKPERVN